VAFGRTKGGSIAMPKGDSDLRASLAAPARRALAAAGYSRLEQFTQLTETEVRKLHGMGPRAIEQIRLALAAKGLTFSN
jgi:DNA-directed RNA polymerase alpha subunit